ncbi:NADH-quinone oxidoreductase [Coprinellus micaceus]|uniref:NADH-quinone oxidoreductase n=1 Tax=Coprinellus micaceus TaxID=71717 RepID=A0A4Y7TC50_COPMI|nr:NADH-quinone oxidoreductase [Coprinellus micaceus]
MSVPKVAIIIHTTFGTIHKLAEAEKAGIEKAGGKVDLYQIPETLPADILAKMNAAPKPDYPIITPDKLAEYDAFLLGIPAAFGAIPSQWKSFLDSTGQIWATGGLAGKYAGVFVSTGGQGGGQEVTTISVLSTLVHHGIIFVPLGYTHALEQQGSLEEVHRGSPWAAGAFSGHGGSRKPSELEFEIARRQGVGFWNTVSKVKF